MCLEGPPQSITRGGGGLKMIKVQVILCNINFFISEQIYVA